MPLPQPVLVSVRGMVRDADQKQDQYVVSGKQEIDPEGKSAEQSDQDDKDDHGGWSLDRQPYHLETSVPGVFAVGDVRAESAKRVASAVGEGAMAVMLVHRYLETL